MHIIWDKHKNERLQQERGVSFEDVAAIVLNNKEIDFIENPVRLGQAYYIVTLNNYIHVVPAIINDKGQIVLKTIFPSRKFNNIYGDGRK